MKTVCLKPYRSTGGLQARQPAQMISRNRCCSWCLNFCFRTNSNHRTASVFESFPSRIRRPPGEERAGQSRKRESQKTEWKAISCLCIYAEIDKSGVRKWSGDCGLCMVYRNNLVLPQRGRPKYTLSGPRISNLFTWKITFFANLWNFFLSFFTSFGRTMCLWLIGMKKVCSHKIDTCS